MERHTTRVTHGAALFATVVAAFMIGACATNSALVNMWKDPEGPRQPLANVMVISIRRNEMMRRVWEDRFVEKLSERGARAVPSYRVYPDRAPDTTQIAEAVRTSGFDGVIVIHGLGTTTTSHYVQGYTTLEPVNRLNPWTGYYHTYYDEVYSPGYTETDQVLRYQIDVYSAHDAGSLVWSGVTETIDPSSETAVYREVSHLIIPELAHAGVVPNRK